MSAVLGSTSCYEQLQLNDLCLIQAKAVRNISLITDYVLNKTIE
jgi:hypothetical protein